MAFDFPLGIYMDVQRQRAANQRNLYQDMAGLGQGLGQGISAIGDVLKQKKLKDLLSQMMQSSQPTQGMAPVQGPKLPMPPNSMGSGGGQPLGQAPTMIPPSEPVDPTLQRLLPFLQADPELLKETLPAIAKGEYRSGKGEKGVGLSDYQAQSLAQKDQQFRERMRMQGDIQRFKENMEQQVLRLRKLGLNHEANALDAKIKEWTAQHWFLSNFMDMGPTPSSGDVGGDAGSGSDAGWGPVTVNP